MLLQTLSLEQAKQVKWMLTFLVSGEFSVTVGSIWLGFEFNVSLSKFLLIFLIVFLGTLTGMDGETTEETKAFSCEFCGRKLTNSAELERHIVRHGK